uniref:Uncharacterized protein n=1 Tax=Ornithorhynchus anatinus TaxID=9258 RepID=A0A6I8NV69_ORNAN
RRNSVRSGGGSLLAFRQGGVNEFSHTLNRLRGPPSEASPTTDVPGDSTSLFLPLWASEISSSLLLLDGALKLNPNRDPVAELFPKVKGLDFSLLKMLLTDSEPNTNFGGETTAFVGVSEASRWLTTSTPCQNRTGA